MRAISWNDPIYRLALVELNLQYPQDCKDHILRRAGTSGGLETHPGGEHQKVTKNGQHVTVIPNSVKPNDTCRDIIRKLNKHHQDQDHTGAESPKVKPAHSSIPAPLQKHMDRATHLSHTAKTANTADAHESAAALHRDVANKLGLFHGNAASHHARMSQHHQDMATRLRQKTPPTRL